jgi:SpoVK/Ycf46/Vps4 family AAA+-type ATPase
VRPNQSFTRKDAEMLTVTDTARVSTNTPALPPLSPAQAETYERLEEAIASSPVVVLESSVGFGKSFLVQRLMRQHKAAAVTLVDLLHSTANTGHAGMEAPFMALVETAFEGADLVILDDFDLVGAVFSHPFYARTKMVEATLHALMQRARSQNKCLLFLGSDFRSPYEPEKMDFSFFDGRMLDLEAEHFTEADYRFFLGLALGEAAGQSLPTKRIFDYSPGLNGHQLRQLGALMKEHGRSDEAFVREMIDTRLLITNANVGEIADVKFSDLKGFEQIIADLTTYVLNPLKGDPRFDDIGLAPKRGVLLFGPPGTGKTSIGRALAHQMQGKFFMIDGTIPTEPAKDFYPKVQSVFHAAKKAAPCVLFIDDADVLFQSDRSTGLSRYLLTMLDGLESETSGKVAVIMTAMDPNHMPPALLRSGRVELWIETKPPSESVRNEMIAADVARLPEAFRSYDFNKIANLTAGFNAADMRRIVSDVKALYARDVVEGRKIKAVDDYFAVAAGEVRQNKVLLGLAEAGALKLGQQPEAANPPGAGAGRTEKQKKASRLRDESNQCGGE